MALLPLTWDAGTESRLDAVHRVVGAADTTGGDGAGLVRDLDGYLPGEAVWQQLAQFRTRQRGTVTSIRVPGSWPAIVSGNRDRLGGGIAAFTVHASRDRVGVVDGAPGSSVSRVSFTIFVSCAHGDTAFRLLRLSELDDPLP